MLQTITPEQAGISSKWVTKLIQTLNKRGLATHDLLLMRGDRIFAEYYWKPFHKDFCHRQYSQTKSYVSVAIGLLEEDGLLHLDDKIVDHFPEKIETEVPAYLGQLTIRQMLTMETCSKVPNWFRHTDPDRTHLYFNENTAPIPGGMRFKYDSPGSQVLSSLVEKLSGQTLFDFLNQRIFRHLDAFQTATILKTPNGDSFGDSALVCTPRDMAAFARFVMNYGTWNGQRLMNEAYLRTATSKVVDSHDSGFDDLESYGYGYQFWRCPGNGFFFNGMGGQITFCFPDQDLICVINSDNQGFGAAKALFFAAIEDLVLDHLQDEPLQEDPESYAEALAIGDTLELAVMSGDTTSAFASQLDGRVYRCNENPTGITKFSFTFREDGTGVLHYTNDQGDKALPFGLGKNVFGKFPQYGYSDLYCRVPTTNGFLYDCAASAAWGEPQKLLLRVQIIDRYFGNMFAIFSFRDDVATVTMSKTAEAFLEEYQGEFVAHAVH